MFINASINDSPTIVIKAGGDIASPAHKAVKFDASGNAVLAVAGDVPIGVIIGAVTDLVKAGEDLAVLVKDIGLITAGGTVAPGDPIAVGAGGAAVKAAADDFILGFAITGAAAGGTAQIQITKSGFVPA
jgi:hypothetical protein